MWRCVNAQMTDLSAIFHGILKNGTNANVLCACLLVSLSIFFCLTISVYVDWYVCTVYLFICVCLSVSVTQCVCVSVCVITSNDHPFGCLIMYRDTIDNAILLVDTSTMFATTKHIL